jgi:hypothetical protein
MLYGLAVFTDLFAVSDPNDFTNYVSQEGASVASAASTATGPIPVAVTPVASTAQPTAQPSPTPTSEWPILLLIAGAAYWWYTKNKGKMKTAL